ncbi:MAG TPA: methyltransferase domain-containing protein [Chloroflexia bacterium]|nr:methyltransferase domain-containing protein [Chloroflexia bacterium]
MTTSNPYIFGDPAIDRQRLVTQTQLFSNYILANAHRLVGSDIRRILDLGCGEGQLGLLLQELYRPQAQLVGIDKDERAITTARARAQELGRARVEFEVGDAMAPESVAPGPFDLVYISFLLMHLPRPDQALAGAYNTLRPGGYVWVKDLHLDTRTAIKHPSFKKLGDVMADTMTAIGVNSFISVQVPALLTAAGFTEIREEVEEYALGGSTAEGQATLATILGAFRHAQAMISRVSKVPESEIERWYLDICSAALRSDKELGRARYANIVARRPQ